MNLALPKTRKRISFWKMPTFAMVLWVCLWCNLNTGFWNIRVPNTFSELVNTIRGSLPFAVLPIAAFMLLRRRKLQLPSQSPSRYLLFYGLIASFAAVFSPMPEWSLYWSCAFVASILAGWAAIDRADTLEAAQKLLISTWIATFIVAAIIGYQARGTVFGSAATGYNVLSDLNGLSRSSGVARWAAVPGLVSLVRAYYTRRRGLIAFYLAASAVSFFIVYRMQSRGAVFGSFAALIFAFLVSSKLRRYALPFAAAAIVMIVIVESPETVSVRVASYLERGQNRTDFLSMTGRTRAYHRGTAAFEEAPILGRGQWADRLVVNEHIHNSFLQALLNSGIIGGIPYFASWFAGWWLFYRLQKSSNRLRPEDRIHLLECGTVMMFFTVRAMPETTTASYAVDLLVMIAVYLYLECLTLRTKAIRRSQILQPYPFGGTWTNRHEMAASVGVGRQI